MIKFKVLYRKYILHELHLPCCYAGKKECQYELNNECYKYSFELVGYPCDTLYCGDE